MMTECKKGANPPMLLKKKNKIKKKRNSFTKDEIWLDLHFKMRLGLKELTHAIKIGEDLNTKLSILSHLIDWPGKGCVFFISL